MTCALLLGGATRRQKETVYEKQNGDFGTEVAVGFVYHVFSLLAVSPGRQRETAYEK
jgi:hypothetical protein